MRIATNHGNESVRDQVHHKEYLEDGQIKLRYAVVPNCKTIQEPSRGLV